MIRVPQTFLEGHSKPFGTDDVQRLFGMKARWVGVHVLARNADGACRSLPRVVVLLLLSFAQAVRHQSPVAVLQTLRRAAACHRCRRTRAQSRGAELPRRSRGLQRDTGAVAGRPRP
jgi:hypothetical protein